MNASRLLEGRHSAFPGAPLGALATGHQRCASRRKGRHSAFPPKARPDSPFRVAFAGIALAGASLLTACAPPEDRVGDWRHHGSDLASSKYSPLDQVHAENFGDLEVAWRWESADRRLGDVYDTGNYTATPLMVDGRVYAVTSHGQVAALDAGTGEQLWLYDPRSWERELPTQLPRRTRGIEYWSDGEVARILLATMGKQLVSIDVATGRPDPAFGADGMVDLTGDLGCG